MSDFDRCVEQLQNLNENTRQNAVYKLGRLGDVRALTWLEKSAQDSSVIVRCRTAKSLANFPAEDRTMQTLEMLLGDSSREVYGCTCSTLSQIQTPRAIQLLIEQAVEDEKGWRSIAVHNLIKAGGVVVPAVLEIYPQTEGILKAHFLMVLGRVAGDQARQIFIDALTDSDRMVFWVAQAIQRTRLDSKAIPTLIALLGHEAWGTHATII